MLWSKLTTICIANVLVTYKNKVMSRNMLPVNYQKKVFEEEQLDQMVFTRKAFILAPTTVVVTW